MKERIVIHLINKNLEIEAHKHLQVHKRADGSEFVVMQLRQSTRTRRFQIQRDADGVARVTIQGRM